MTTGIDVSGKSILDVINIIEELDLPDGYKIERKSCNRIVLEYDEVALEEYKNRRKHHGTRR